MAIDTLKYFLVALCDNFTPSTLAAMACELEYADCDDDVSAVATIVREALQRNVGDTEAEDLIEAERQKGG